MSAVDPEARSRLLELLEKINQTALDAAGGGLSMVTVMTLLRSIDQWSDEAEQIVRGLAGDAGDALPA